MWIGGGGSPPGSALAAALEGITRVHGARGGHARAITGVAISGDLLATKDPQSMRMWLSRGDFALLRVVTSRGAHVAFHPGGQFIVTGQRRPRPGPESDGKADATDPGEPRAHVRVRVCVLPPKVWGSAGGSAYTAWKPGLQPKPSRPPFLGAPVPATKPSNAKTDSRRTPRTHARPRDSHP